MGRMNTCMRLKPQKDGFDLSVWMNEVIDAFTVL